ncbi:MAG: hypothetical protein MZU79_06885 [Anaerotruncus sp.]|nr:hypothetical protein [Anaerotruncus sp.]
MAHPADGKAKRLVLVCSRSVEFLAAHALDHQVGIRLLALAATLIDDPHLIPGISGSPCSSPDRGSRPLGAPRRRAGGAGDQARKGPDPMARRCRLWSFASIPFSRARILLRQFLVDLRAHVKDRGHQRPGQQPQRPRVNRNRTAARPLDRQRDVISGKYDPLGVIVPLFEIGERGPFLLP